MEITANTTSHQSWKKNQQRFVWVASMHSDVPPVHSSVRQAGMQQGRIHPRSSLRSDAIPSFCGSFSSGTVCR